MKNGLRTRTYSYGYGSAGLYGKGKEDTTWHAVISTIQIDSLKLSNQAVSFHKKGAKLVGTGFFKHYRLILDWSSGQLIMIPVSPYDNISQKTFRFSFVMKDQQVFIGSVYSGAGEAEGPQLGDQVLEIDGKDYRNCNAGNYCSLLGLRFNTQASTMSLLVKRGDKELTFKVAKETLIQL